MSDLTADSASAILNALSHLQDILDDEDDDLPIGLVPALNELRVKLQTVKVCMTATSSTCLYRLYCRMPLFPKSTVPL